MASIRKRNNRWEVRVRRRGYPTQTKTFTHKSSAQIWAKETELDLETAHLKSAPFTKSPTLAAAVERYLSETIVRHKGARSAVYRLRRITEELGGDRSIAEITELDISAYRNKRLSLVTAGSVRRELVLISGLFQTARNEWGLRGLRNPVGGIKMPPDSPSRSRRLNPCEKELLITESKGVPHLHLAIQLALQTGMRQSEILKLSYADLDFDRHLILVKDTKNGDDRIIPMAGDIEALLRPSYAENSPIFRISQSGLQQAFRKLIKRCELKDLRFHDLRHEALSSFFEAGLSLPEVKLLSGHRTVDQLMRYSHAHMTEIKRKLALQ